MPGAYNEYFVSFLRAKASLCIFLIAGIPFCSYSQALEMLPVTMITKSDGLSLTDNRFVYTDTKGFTWISSAHGLHRYDGKHIRLYLPNEQDSFSLRGLIINGLFSEDKESNIWFCTYDAIQCYVRAKDNFLTFRYPQSESQGYYSIGLDSIGQFWMMFDTLLLTFDIYQHTFTSYGNVKSGANRGQFLTNEKGKVAYVVTYNNDRSSTGFQIHDFRKSEKAAVSTYYTSDSQYPISVRGLCLMSDTMMWIASRTGLYSFQFDQGQIVKYSPFPEKEFVNFNAVEKLNDSLILVVSYGSGAFTFNTHQHRFVNQFRMVYKEQEVLEPPQAIFRDRDGGLWISFLGRGLAYYHPDNLLFHFYRHQISDQLLNSGINPNSMIELPDQHIWISSNLHGAVIMKDGQTVEKHFEKEITPGLTANNNKMSLMDSKGRIWMLTAQGPCIRTVSDNITPFLKDNVFFAISACEWRNGEMILGTYSGGLYKSLEGNGMPNRVERIKTVHPSKVYTLLYEHADSLIYGTADLALLDIYDPNKDFKLIQSIPFRVNAQCMVSMNHGTEIWIGTDQGIFIYSIKEGKLHPFDWMPELKELIVYGIVPSGESSIWLSTNQGLYQLDTLHRSFEKYGLENGTGSVNFNPNSFLHRSNGEIWFGSLDGITVIDPFSRINEVPVKHVNLTNFLINDEVPGRLICTETGATNIAELKSIELPYRDNTLSIEFTAMDYAGPDHAIYEYRMTGADKNWINSLHHGFARYGNLAPGQYKFEARVVNATDGSYSPVRSLNILIRAPFYMKSWFIALVAGLAIATLALLFKMYEKRKQKLQQLEFEKRIALESERLRIANDMHDDLGSGLSALNLRAKLLAQQVDQPELRSQMNDLVSNAGRLAQIVRETIWTINSKNDSVDNLVTRLHQYALEYFQGTIIQCTVDLMQEQVNTSIPGHHRRELYLAYKEALHNVIKHAQATTVNISIELQPSNLLVILIRDNGKGFNPADQGDGLGIGSMHKHMQNIGGQFQIRADHQGTQVTLTYPF